MRKHYFAYGINMNRKEMERRCPQAVPVGVAKLDNWAFCINHRGVATVVPSPDSVTEGVLWSVTDDCLQVLDEFEGVAFNSYQREIVDVRLAGTEIRAEVYISDWKGPGEARPGYLQGIIEGAEDFGLSYDYREDLEVLTWTYPPVAEVTAGVAEARAHLQELRVKVKAGDFGRSDSWRSKQVVVAVTQPAPRGGGFYPEPVTLVTHRAEELSWVFTVIHQTFAATPFYDRFVRCDLFDRIADLVRNSTAEGDPVPHISQAAVETALKVLGEIADDSFSPELVVAR